LVSSDLIIDKQADAPSRPFHDHHQPIVQRTGARREAESPVQPDDRQVLIPEAEHLAAVRDGGDLARCQTHGLDGGRHRHDVGLITHRQQQAVHDCEREWQGDQEA